MCAIDFMNVRLNTSEKALLDNLKLDFKCDVMHRTGEVLCYPIETKSRYKSFNFFISQKNCFGKGSIHKYFHGNNWSDLTFHEQIQALNSFCNEFKVEKYRSRVHSFEFAVNINPNFEASVENISKLFICHGYKPFVPLTCDKTGKEIGVFLKYDQYGIKIYSKSVQLGISKNILRFEVKVRKIQWLTDDYIFLEDFERKEFMLELKEKLLSIMRDIIVYDDDIKPSTINEKLFLSNVSNPNYWKNIKSKQKRYKDKQRYKKMVSEKSISKIHESILLDIESNCNYLINN